MYYRKSSYPKSGHADVPDELWREFQRIRSNLSSVDQNNVASDTIGRDLIVPPFDLDHNGISDIVGDKGQFLYEEKAVSSGSIKNFDREDSETWYDLGRKGLRLKAISRGDCPWIVGASVSARVQATGRIKADTRSAFRDPTWRDGPGSDAFAEALTTVLRNPFNSIDALGPAPDEEQRGSFHLRLHSSQGGLSAAESVGGINAYAVGCSLATVGCFFVKGGPVEFSPHVLFRSILNDTEWEFDVYQANIFAFGLYR